VTFANNERRIYDVKPLINHNEYFATLRDVKGLFNMVRVDSGSYGVSWNSEIDLSANELYCNGAIA
jgi:hypothetical protein